MRFNEYLINEGKGRTKPIGKAAAMKFLKTKCSAAVRSFMRGMPIYRGLGVGDFPFGVVAPAKSVRQSANTMNYYTLLTSNSKRWKDFPRRDSSIICTTERDVAESFGWEAGAMNVFPVNGSRVGICPEPDFWLSFEPSFGLVELEVIMSHLHDVMGWIGSKSANFPPLTYKDMLSFFKEITPEELRSYYDEQEYAPYGGEIFADFTKGKFIDYMEEKFDPKKNKFKVVKIGQNIPTSDHEVWTDGLSLMIKASIMWNPKYPDERYAERFQINFEELQNI